MNQYMVVLRKDIDNIQQRMKSIENGTLPVLKMCTSEVILEVGKKLNLTGNEWVKISIETVPDFVEHYNDKRHWYNKERVLALVNAKLEDGIHPELGLTVY